MFLSSSAIISSLCNRSTHRELIPIFSLSLVLSPCLPCSISPSLPLSAASSPSSSGSAPTVRQTSVTALMPSRRHSAQSRVCGVEAQQTSRCFSTRCSLPANSLAGSEPDGRVGGVIRVTGDVMPSGHGSSVIARAPTSDIRISTC